MQDIYDQISDEDEDEDSGIVKEETSNNDNPFKDQLLKEA